MEIKTLQVGPIGTNCYLLCDTASARCAIIDPGGDAEAVAAAVKASGASPCAILLTHGHYDHTGAVAELSAQWPEAPVYLSRRDQSGDNAPPQLFPHIPGAKDYGEGACIAVGTLTVTVLATPGHSEGSVTLRCGDALFCGDTLFAASCGRTDFPGGSMVKMLDSLYRLGSLEGDFRVYPGHMEPSTLERERRTNPYLLQAMAQHGESV
ncbi:MBL fold metallo-hydrolase [Oscillibacter sp.]|uniref:MBL fold metallo-hydrolase n=1 Tax=Oscillibacter sp. TaxID=1945593 RepID=UPI002635C40F|nr:MBL fold metallo-hydrolase [Oscillibacter sp.]MDD3347577.1 MBL fold metallo-hydrolase [Oscillibacter sp.]